MSYNSDPSQQLPTPAVLELRPGLEQLTWPDGTTEKRWSAIGQTLKFDDEKRPETGNNTPVLIELEEWRPDRGTETRTIGIANGVLVEYEPGGKPINPQAWANLTYGAQRAVGDTAKNIIPTITIGAQLHLPFPGYGASGKVLSARAMTALGGRIGGEPNGKNVIGKLVYDEDGSDQWRRLIQDTEWMCDGRDTYHGNMDPRAKQPSSLFDPKIVSTLGGMVHVGEKHMFDFLRPRY